MIRRIADKAKRKLSYIHNESRIKRCQPEVASMKNIHEGQRCFIIGNGPSLRIEDLERLKGEITFGVHNIFKLYSKTYWRATYYVAQDSKLLENIGKQMKSFIAEKKFIPIVVSRHYRVSGEAMFLRFDEQYSYPDPPGFSDDISKVIYEGMTVTYAAIQIAVYMGFKEIYLIGVDHSYSATKKPDGTIEKHEGVKDYAFAELSSQKFSGAFVPQLEKTTLAYRTANEYANTHGIRIYNATRGGKLEEFERVDFDKLF